MSIRLLTDCRFVWVTIILIKAFVITTLRLMRNHKRISGLIKATQEQVDLAASTLRQSVSSEESVKEAIHEEHDPVLCLLALSHDVSWCCSSEPN